MNFPGSSSPKSPAMQLQQALTNLQTNCTSILSNISTSFTTHLNSHLPNFALSSSSSSSSSSSQTQNSAHILPSVSCSTNVSETNNVVSMSNKAIGERLMGVHIYAVIVSPETETFPYGLGCSFSRPKIWGRRDERRNLSLFCFKKEDADSILDQYKELRLRLPSYCLVYPLPLNKVFRMEADGICFRYIPEALQIKNALTLKEMKKAGSLEGEFAGVPVFQCRRLTCQFKNSTATYCPLFFSKEDLVKTFRRTHEKMPWLKLGDALAQEDIEVAGFEDVINGMKDGSCQKWNDALFLPPGFKPSKF